MDGPSKKKLKRDTDSEHGESEVDDVETADDERAQQDAEAAAEEEEEDDEYDAKAFIEEERSKLSALIEVFTEEELRRFEAARRCSLSTKEVQRTMKLVLGMDAKGSAEVAKNELGMELPHVDEKTAVLMAGLTKMYLAELIERACMVSAERGSTIRLQPKHLREAYRRMKREGRVPGSPIL